MNAIARKIVFLAVAFAAVVLGAAREAPVGTAGSNELGPELFVNGGFEDGPEPWSGVNLNSEAGWTSVDGNPGASFIIYGAGAAADTDPSVSQAVTDLTVGGTYRVAGDYVSFAPEKLGDPAKPDAFRVRIWHAAGSGSQYVDILGLPRPTPADAWTRFSVDFVAPDEKVELIFLAELDGDESAFRVDNLSLREVLPPPPVVLPTVRETISVGDGVDVLPAAVLPILRETIAVEDSVLGNVVPKVTIASAPETLPVLVEGTVVATFSDPDDSHTATVDWGDGTSGPAAVAPPSASNPGRVTAAHGYPAVGTYTVELCVTDSAGASGCAETQISVVNPRGGILAVIADLAVVTDDPAVSSAIGSLRTSLDLLESSDEVAAVLFLRKAIDSLLGGRRSFASTLAGTNGGGYAVEVRLIAEVGESIARDLLAKVDALGLESRGATKQVETIRALVAKGHVAIDDGRFADAIAAFQDATQRAKDLLLKFAA